MSKRRMNNHLGDDLLEGCGSSFYLLIAIGLGWWGYTLISSGSMFFGGVLLVLATIIFLFFSGLVK
jgi:hypothetical protein